MHLLWEFRSANGYYLYATFDPVRYQVEFEGSNDGGQTWRTYEFRHLPQREDRICSFIAPWFCRFEATLQIAGWNGKKSPLMPAVAAHLLVRDQAVMDLFAHDPFPDRPPTMIRMRGYRMFFTDFSTHRRTGQYWRRKAAGNYLPMLYLDGQGAVVQSSLEPGEAALRARDYPAARIFFTAQYAQGNLEAGFRLADIYLQGLGIAAEPAKAFAIFSDLARAGELTAEYELGICYEHGLGVPVDNAAAATWYRLAARHGSLPAVFNLGLMHARDAILPRDDVEGLALLLEAETRAMGDDPASSFILEHYPVPAKLLKDRMSRADIAAAKARAADRSKTPVPTEESP